MIRIEIDHDSPARLSQVVEAVVHPDSPEPCLELRPLFEAAQPEECFHEHFLCQVLGVGGRTRDDAAVRQHAALVAPHQRVERPRVAVIRLRPQHELLVRFGVRAGRQSASS
ncbi:MAG TPA: hypothetical protein PLH72_12950 [Vicinamibacterales bacterium]|nr:hypothetical protein [Vicinamibacterales bacterium]